MYLFRFLVGLYFFLFLLLLRVGGGLGGGSGGGRRFVVFRLKLDKFFLLEIFKDKYK